MGKEKSARSKRRKAKKAHIEAVNRVVSDAKGLSNKTLLEYTRLSRDDESVVEKLSARVKWYVVRPTEIDVHLRDDIFQLFEANMKAYYESSWGYNAEEKKRELFHGDARFLLLKEISGSSGGGEEEEEGSLNHSPGTLIAFCHFRFELDPEAAIHRAVIYVYEIQVSKPWQCCGIGKLIMNAVESLGRFANDMSTSPSKFCIRGPQHQAPVVAFYRCGDCMCRKPILMAGEGFPFD